MDSSRVLKCVLCGKDAISTVVHILVCEEHYKEYHEEARKYSADRPFYLRLLEAQRKLENKPDVYTSGSILITRFI